MQRRSLTATTLALLSAATVSAFAQGKDRKNCPHLQQDRSAGSPWQADADRFHDGSGLRHRWHP